MACVRSFGEDKQPLVSRPTPETLNPSPCPPPQNRQTITPRPCILYHLYTQPCSLRPKRWTLNSAPRDPETRNTYAAIHPLAPE